MHDFNWVEISITYSSPSKSVEKSNIIETFVNLWKIRKGKTKKI